jgi:hypothetical protein
VRIGLDLDGPLDECPKFFSFLSAALRSEIPRVRFELHAFDWLSGAAWRRIVVNVLP